MSKELYRGRILHLIEEDVILPSGNKITLEIFHHPGAAAVAVYCGTKFFLIRQFRHAAGGYLWEIPAGTLEKDEPPINCAHRELKEEAGFVAGEMRELGQIFTVPGFCTERIHLYLATDIKQTSSSPEDDEVIDEVRGFSPGTVLQMIEDGEIIDAKSLVALYHAFRALGLSLERAPQFKT